MTKNYLYGIEHLHTMFNATTVAFDCEPPGCSRFLVGCGCSSWQP